MGPGRQTLDIRSTEITHERVKVLPLDRWLILELLNEMTVPVKPRPKTARPASLNPTTALKNLTHGEATPGEISGEPGTPREGSVRAGNRAAIVLHTLAQEMMEFVQTGMTATMLAMGARIRLESKFSGRRQFTR